MRLAVVGAAGRTGRPLVAQALERGHSVTAFVRSPPTDGPLAEVDRVVVGDARDVSAVRAALREAEAVVSAMGPTGPEPGTTYSEAVSTLASVMEAAGPRRLVISANARVLDDRPLHGEFAAVSQEHRDALAALRSCDLDWTVVATPMLADDDPRGRYAAAVGERSRGTSITRADFAAALLDAVDRDDWITRVVDVTSEA